MAPRHPHCGFVDTAIAAVDLALLRSLRGGRELSGEMLLILVFITFDGYELFPPRQPKEAWRAGSTLD